MARTLPKVDAVVVGFGWTGAIAAKELVDAGLSVVALERGPAHGQDDFGTRAMHDGLRFAVRHALAHPLDRETLTFRNRAGETALPMRRIGSFNPGEGFGGSGNTWSGHTPRALPSDLVLRSHYARRYGEGIFPEDTTSRDWGINWDEIEPHYDHFERVAAVSGTAGNVGGTVRPAAIRWRGRARPTTRCPHSRGTAPAGSSSRRPGAWDTRPTRCRWPTRPRTTPTPTASR